MDLFRRIDSRRSICHVCVGKDYPRKKGYPVSSKVFQTELVKFIPDMRRFGRSLVRDDDVVDDIVGDTIVMAFKNWSSFEPGTNMRSWLFQIEAGIFKNWRRKNRTRANCEDQFETSDSETVMSVVGENSPQFSAVELSDVGKIIDRLPSDQKSVLYLMCYGDHSAEDAARILDCKLGTVYSRLSRARATIAAAINGNDPEPCHEATNGPRP